MDPVSAVTTIKTVSDVISAARGGFSDGYKENNPRANSNSLRTYSYSSAAAAASKLIAVFPVLTSRTVSSETTQMISKYIEQKGCIILQLALQAANISNAKNGMDYLRNFHQNLNIGGDGLDALTKTMDLWISGFDQNSVNTANDEDIRNGAAYRQESATLSSYLSEDMREVDDSEIYESDNSIRLSPIQMKELLEMFEKAENIQTYDTKLNPISISDYCIVEDYKGDYHVSLERVDGLLEASGNKQRKKDYYKNASARAAEERQKLDREARKIQQKKEKEREEDRARKIRNEDEDRALRQQDREDARRDKEESRAEHREDREAARRERENKAATTLRKTKFEFLNDQDIKKMNNAVPSLLIVRFYNDSSASVCTEFIIGVKSKVLGVNSDEILRRIANDNADGKWFLNLMRTMTGELKASDFLFGLSRTNEDLQALRKKGSQGDTWALLKNRALAAKEAVKQGRLNNYSAITTVVISQEDCDELYREENLDINNPSVARHFMESYNLLGFIITDDSTESLKVMFDDGDKYFEELSYRMLERETSDGTYKKLINLITSTR